MWAGSDNTSGPTRLTRAVLLLSGLGFAVGACGVDTSLPAAAPEQTEAVGEAADPTEAPVPTPTAVEAAEPTPTPTAEPVAEPTVEEVDDASPVDPSQDDGADGSDGSGGSVFGDMMGQSGTYSRDDLIEELTESGDITEAQANCIADGVEENFSIERLESSGDLTEEEEQLLVDLTIDCILGT